jgi:hypothetical protein
MKNLGFILKGDKQKELSLSTAYTKTQRLGGSVQVQNSA